MFKKEITIKDAALLKKALLEVETKMRQHNLEGLKFLQHLNQSFDSLRSLRIDTERRSLAPSKYQQLKKSVHK